MAVVVETTMFCDKHPVGGRKDAPKCAEGDAIVKRIIFDPLTGQGYEGEFCLKGYEDLGAPVHKVIDRMREIPPHECPVIEAPASGKRKRNKSLTDHKRAAMRWFFGKNPELGTVHERGRLTSALVALFDKRFPEWAGWELGDDIPEGWTPKGEKIITDKPADTDTPEEEEETEEEEEEEGGEVPSPAPFSEGDPRNLGRDFTPAFTG